MGIVPTPDPGEFAAGDQCDTCTLTIPIFAPARTPATVRLTRFGGPGDPTTWDLPQTFPCIWNLNTPAIQVYWHAVLPIGFGSQIRIVELILGIWTLTFRSRDARFCITERPNDLFIGAVGTYAIVEWE